MEETAIDDVVLGAPFDDDPNAVSDAPPAIAVALDPQPTESPLLRVEAGCAWDKENHSCAYDSVIMVLWFVRRKASPRWRNKWQQQAPEWNNPFETAFGSLITMAQNRRTSKKALSHAFDSLRETFRDKLSAINPGYFRRHGAVPASVCRILGHIFSNSTEHEPCLEQVVTCDWCGTSTPYRCSFTLLGTSTLLDAYLDEDDTSPFLPLQTAVTRYIQHISRVPWPRTHCTTCSKSLRVESLSMPETAWLWIELCDAVSPIAPSPRLVFGLQDQQRAYTLQAIIYLGGGHFTARLSDRSGTWWKYDGMWRSGTPRVDYVEDEIDLLENDGRRAAFLLYFDADLQY